MVVPAVLTSGHHEAIHLWNYEQSLRLTARFRPDLLSAYLEKHRENKSIPPLTKKEYQILIQFLP
jgi:tRNA (guanine-N1)-methyltransferase